MAEALLRLTENTSLRGVQREDQEPVGTKRKQLDEMEFAEREIKLRSMRVDTVRNFSEVMSMLDEDWKRAWLSLVSMPSFCSHRHANSQSSHM